MTGATYSGAGVGNPHNCGSTCPKSFIAPVENGPKAQSGYRWIIRHRIGSSQRTARQLLEEIVRPQHHRSFSIDWPFEELTRCSLLNRIAQSHKLIYSLIFLHIMLVFKIVHCRGADRTPHHVALIKHCEINDHPIEVVAQHFTSLQRHCNLPVLQASDYATTGGARGVPPWVHIGREARMARTHSPDGALTTIT